jgi:hypothetical protein
MYSEIEFGFLISRQDIRCQLESPFFPKGGAAFGFRIRIARRGARISWKPKIGFCSRFALSDTRGRRPPRSPFGQPGDFFGERRCYNARVIEEEVPMRALMILIPVGFCTAAALACATKGEGGQAAPVAQAAPASGVVEMGAAAKKASFAADVLPIFKASCARCHGNAGDLALDTYAAVMAGAKGKPVVAPGDPNASDLLKSVDGRAAPRMPMGADPLPAAQITAIRDWIAAGAKND